MSYPMKVPERAVCCTVLKTSTTLHIHGTTICIIVHSMHICVIHRRQGLRVLLFMYVGATHREDRREGKSNNEFDVARDSWASVDKKTISCAGYGVNFLTKLWIIEQGTCTAILTLDDTYLGLMDDEMEESSENDHIHGILH